MRRWKDFSIAAKLYTVIGIMAVLIAGELLALNFAMGTVSAVRAFVGGESMWSKSQKNAVMNMQRYASSRKPDDFEAFLASLRIPEGDHRARLELQKLHPDMAVVRAGFTQGGVHPDDIDPMVRLLRRFHWEQHIAKAVAAWTEGDRLLEEFKAAAFKFSELAQAPKTSPEVLQDQLRHMRKLNEDLTLVESDFSNVLGEGSRWLETVIISLLFLAVLTVETIGLTLTILTSRSISRGLSRIHAASVKIGQGEFDTELKADSHDEIGALATSIDSMRVLLKKSYEGLEVRVKERTAELSKLAAENANLYEQANQALRSRDEFLSIASHELRTPLTALSLQLDLLTKQVRSGKTASLEEALALFGKHVKRLGGLSNDLMDITHIRMGKFEIKREVCDLAVVARDIVAQIRPEAERLGCELRLEAESVRGNFDSIRVGQILTNLLTNAVKYGSGQPVEISLHPTSTGARMIVKDQGKGIAPEFQTRIFESFERANAGKDIPGLGLGLYITRQIVVAHGGKISVQSQPGAGSTFVVEIPA